MIDLLLALSLSPAPLTPAQDAALGWIDPKRTIHEGMPALAEELTDVSRRVWEWAELALTERRSSEALADMLMHAGFAVERGISDMETAWVASYGSGEPVIAYLAEFDALPSLSQTATTSIEARIPGEPGHGCGHNLFGAGSVGAGIALKLAMQAHDLPGTVRVYGTPAEEHGIGKVFLVRDGHFDDVDVCLSWHPSNENEVSLQPSKAARPTPPARPGRRSRRSMPSRPSRPDSTSCASTCPSRRASTTSSPTAARRPTSCPTRPACGSSRAAPTGPSRSASTST